MLEDPKLISVATVKNGQTIAIMVKDHSSALAERELGLSLKCWNYSLVMEPGLGFSPDLVYRTARKATSLQIVC